MRNISFPFLAGKSRFVSLQIKCPRPARADQYRGRVFGFQVLSKEESIRLDSPNAMSKQSVTENSANKEGGENSKIVLRKPRIGGIYKQYKRVMREYVLVSISYLFGTKSLNACF